MYKIKQTHEDFKVKELKNISPKESGGYMICLMKKKDYTTQKAVELISNFFRIKSKCIGYAGAKDRHAVTEQYISIKGNNFGKILDFKTDRIELKFIGFSDSPICLGELDGNEFEIAVRNLDDDEKSADALENFESNPSIPNYFDEQRFSKNNADAGKALLRRDFRKAAELISETNPSVKTCLGKNKTDYAGAIRILPKKILLMYMHAYQSYIFNKILSAYIKSKSNDYREVEYSLGKFVFPLEVVDNLEIPVVGFDTDNSSAVSDFVEEVLEEEKVSRRSFVMREIPELTCAGDARDAFADVENFSYELADDELNEGKKKCVLKFRLHKGSYATIVVKRLFG